MTLAFAFALLLTACAAAPRARPSAEPRMNDSAPEKVAAQRSAARGLQLEEDNQRWGLEAARARRREAEQKKQATQTEPPPSGPVDLRKPSPARPADQ